MAAVIRRRHFAYGSIRLGPNCFQWGDPYTRSLSFEVERVNVAVIGGLTRPMLSDEETGWIEAALINAGLRAAMDRVVRDSNGKPLRDANGDVVFRRVMLPMSNWPKRQAGSL